MTPAQRLEHDRRIVAARQDVARLRAQHAAAVERAAAPALVAAARAMLDAAQRLEAAGKIAALATAAVNRADYGDRQAPAVPAAALRFMLDRARAIVGRDGYR